MNADGFSEPRAVFERLARKFGRLKPRGSQSRREAAEPFSDGRDPGSMSDAFEDLSTMYGWNAHLARAELLAEWEHVVGVDVAAHTTPVSSDHGIVEVHCDSNAWATQLRMIRAQVLSTLHEKFPLAEIVEVRIKAPGAPSWKHGRRSVSGRGPRDTYS